MNSRQKEVLQSRLDDEKKVLKQLEKIYENALSDIDDKIAILKGRDDTENLQSVIYQQQHQEALKAQISGILDVLHGEEFSTISEYLTEAYEKGFTGTLYDLHGQGIPLIFPIDQESVVRAVQLDSKISKGLYERLGEDVTLLKKRIANNISRGIAQGASYSEIAQNIRHHSNVPLSNANRIARTEGHRIQNEAASDAQHKAKERGADIVKQWDSTLDGRTRESHRAVDGEVRELDKPFSNKLMYPGDSSGSAAEVVNCRCALLQRAKWAVNDTFTKWDAVNKELLTLQPNSYGAFKKAYSEMILKNQSINKSTEKLLEEAKKVEPKITRDLLNITRKASGEIDYAVSNGKTALDFRLKEFSSLKRKVTSDFVKGDTLAYIEEHIYDCVRYTCLSNAENLVSDFVIMQNEFAMRGYKIRRIKNTLGDMNSAYRGLNIVVETVNGYKFELQFHTPESIEIKERVHKIYEKSRLDTTTVAEQAEMNKEMLDISGTLPDIPNIKEIKSFDTFKGDKAVIVQI